MTPFVEILPVCQSLMGLWMLLLLWRIALLCCISIQTRRFKGAGFLIVCVLMVYILFQSDVACICGNANVPEGFFFIQGIVELPWLLVFLFCLALTMLEIVDTRRSTAWIESHITNISVKQAVDMLPVGICFYDERGRIWLKNYTVDRMCREVTGESLLNGGVFYGKMIADNLKEGCRLEKMSEKTVLVSGAGRAYSITQGAFPAGKHTLYQIVAADITEEYIKTRTLMDKQEQMQEANQRLTAYSKEIVDVISAREILNAKVKIHDELGVNLLAAKNYIHNGGTEEEKNSIISNLRKNIDFLKQAAEPTQADEYTRIMETAEKLGVKINRIGPVPGTQPARKLIATAVHECLTNTLRHAHGDELTVTINENEFETRAEFTNNGNQPEDDIVEKGGLLSVRMLVEQAGGEMRVSVAGGFLLQIRIPKEGRTHEDSSADC